MVYPIPDNYPRLTPYLTVDDAEAAIAFYTDVLGGAERMRLPMPGGKIGHSEITFGEALIMLADKDPMMGNKSPADFGGSPVSLTYYCDDVDAMVHKAVAAGAKLVQPIEDHFYGDRAGSIEDPWGHTWTIMTHIEDVSPEEMEKRMAEMMAEGS